MGQPGLIDRAETIRHHDHEQVRPDRQRKIGPIASLAIDRRRDATRTFENPPVARLQGLRARHEHFQRDLFSFRGRGVSGSQRCGKRRQRHTRHRHARQALRFRRIALLRRRAAASRFHDFHDLHARAIGRQQAGQCLALLFRRKLQCREQIVWRHGDHRPVRIVPFRTILVRPVPQHRG